MLDVFGEASGPATDDLVLRAQGGDRSAYNALFARLERRLLVYLRLRLGQRKGLEPADVLQEVYLRTHRAFDGFTGQGEGSFCGWVYTITDNCLRDLIERGQALKRQPPGQLHQGSWVVGLPTPQTSPSSVCARQEGIERLALALERLDTEQREAIVLRYIQEQTLVETARRLGCSEPAVRRLLGRARLRLGRELAK